MRTALALLLAASLGGAALAAGSGFETTNLLANGGFEQPGSPPPGWKLEVGKAVTAELSPAALNGKAALRAAFGGPGTLSAAADPVAVEPGALYALSLWFRAEGMSTKPDRSYDGCGAGVVIAWLDGAGKTLASSWLLAGWYGPVPEWRLATATMIAPPGSARMQIAMNGSVADTYTGPPTVMWLDEMRLLKLGSWALPPGAKPCGVFSGTEIGSVKTVSDPQATRGKASFAPAGVAGTGARMSGGPYSRDPAGLYMAVFRIKVQDNTLPKPAVELTLGVEGGGEAGLIGAALGRLTVLCTDFRQAGVYQDFAVPYLRPEGGILGLGVVSSGNTNLWYDQVSVYPLQVLSSDREKIAVWLGELGETSPGAPGAPAARRTVLLMQGLWHEIMVPTGVFAPEQWEVEESYLLAGQQGFAAEPVFPTTPEALAGYRLIVMANVSSAALHGFRGRLAMRRYLERGGALLLLGGCFALGKGELEGCAFEDLLPFSVSAPWDLVKPTASVVTPAPGPLTDGLRWEDQPAVGYYHRIVARPGARVAVAVDGSPLLVTGTYGAGRVAVLAATPMAPPAAPVLSLYGWGEYPELLRRVTTWLTETR